jgi:hypothetical protein
MTHLSFHSPGITLPFRKSVAVSLTFLLLSLGLSARAEDAAWTRPPLTEPNRVEMGGAWGDSYQRGLARLAKDPFTTNFVLADLNFNMERWFTNFSGDISGRFTEVTALSSTRENPQPPILREVLTKIPENQKADGHFGIEMDWNQPIDADPTSDKVKMLPMLWGNARLLLGLTAAWERFEDPRIQATARKLGDFYVNVVVERFCDPKRMDEYKKPAQYASAYVTCVFEGMEGLVRLYRLTKDERYLKTALRMADFHEEFDTLPVGHSHGSISEHEALILLYEETGNAKFLKRATTRWDAIVQGGFVNASGGVLEKFWTVFDRDEGCSESDWLRLNLMLWRNTGQTRYLDMAERLMTTEYPANQWPTGGFGHRFIVCDDQGPIGFKDYSQESLWCCSFHCPLGLRDLKGYLATGGTDGIRYNFPVDFKAPVQTGKTDWTVTSKALPAQDGVPVRCEVTLEGPANATTPFAIRVPEWADRVVVKVDGKDAPTTKKGGYTAFEKPLASGAKVEVAYSARPYLEDRRCKRIETPKTLPATLDKVALRYGPGVLVNADSGDVQPLTLTVGADGALQLPKDGPKLLPWGQLTTPGAPHAFLFNAKVEAGK